MKKSSNIFLKLISGLSGIFFITFIALSLISFAKFLYFPSKLKPVEEDVFVNKYSKTISRSAEIDHFHIIDKEVYSDVGINSTCLRCHGNFCHTKSEELRSFYNMHTFYLACETCHIRKNEGEKFVFKLFDNISENEVLEFKGSQGSYHAKIVPVKNGQRLDRSPEGKMALVEYLKMDTHPEAQEEKILDEFMQHVSEEAVTCRECHKKGGYLNFSSLGYDPSRINRLTRLEIMKLIEEYNEFYLPTMFVPQ